MNTLTRLAFVLGLILALSVTGYAVGGEAPNSVHRTMHHHKRDFAKATAVVTPLGAVVAPSTTLPDTDGLSRRDEDCNRGCIDH